MGDFFKISGSVMSTIIVTGLVLNMAGRGIFGETAKKIATYTTEGYGV